MVFVELKYSLEYFFPFITFLFFYTIIYRYGLGFVVAGIPINTSARNPVELPLAPKLVFIGISRRIHTEIGAMVLQIPCPNTTTDLAISSAKSQESTSAKIIIYTRRMGDIANRSGNRNDANLIRFCSAFPYLLRTYLCCVPYEWGRVFVLSSPTKSQ